MKAECLFVTEYTLTIVIIGMYTKSLQEFIFCEVHKLSCFSWHLFVYLYAQLSPINPWM